MSSRMATNRTVLLIALVGLLIAPIVSINLKVAMARPSEDSAAYKSLLPFLSVPPPPPKLKLVPFVSDLGSDTITAIVNAGDDRLFVVERWGRIRIIQPDGTIREDPFLDIIPHVVTDNWEEGVMGLVFHPDYPAVPYFFVVYTPDHTHVRLSRFAVHPHDANLALEDSEAILFTIDKKGEQKHGVYRVHNGGDMHFGPDGYLYVAIGDGGPDPMGIDTRGDPDQRGQSTDDLLANILRIDVDQNTDGLPPDCGTDFYTVPEDNPFADGPQGACDELWSIGLRNPFRFSFDSLTGDMFIGEVGESWREEVLFQPADSKGGQNYGWACYEGSLPYRISDPFLCPPGTDFTMPTFEYDQPDTCASVIGGYVYRGTSYPDLYGRYLFADFCSRKLWLLNGSAQQSWQRSEAGETNSHISTFGVDVNGELYAGEWRAQGKPDIYRVVVDS
jgi:glucose/arabinose dehydrogenase